MIRLLLLLLLLAAAPVRADPPPLAAVGLIDLLRGSGCTGTLIAPDLVLTAAHCLNAWATLGPIIRVMPRFHPSLADGTAGPGLSGAAVMLQPDWRKLRAAAPYGPATLSHDLALLRLAAPVGPAVARPLPVAAPGAAADTLLLASFRGARGGPMRQRTCPVIGIEKGVMEVACGVRKGESGAPLLRLGPAGAELAAVVSARSGGIAGEMALGPALPGTLPALVDGVGGP